MPFDGIEYGVQPLIGPPQHLSSNRMVGDLLRRSLASAYGYLRSNHGYLGNICWQQHPRRDTQQLTFGTLSAPSTIAATQVLLPDWATHVVASLSYYVEELPSITVGFRVVAGSDTGALIQQQHEPLRTLDAVGPAGVIVFQSGQIDAFVERASTSSSNVDISFQFGADNNEEASPTRVKVRPQIITFYWVAVG